MTSFATITDFDIRFGKHPKGHDEFLNSAYQGALLSRDDFFTDPIIGGYSTLKPDRDLRYTATTEIVNFVSDLASETVDDNEILTVIDKAALSIEVGNKPKRFNKVNLEKALIEALRNKQDSILITISTNGMYFDNSSGDLSYLDWSKISTIPFGTTTTPAATLTAADIANAVASAIPAPPSAQDLATAFANSVSTILTNANNPGGASTSTVTPTTAPSGTLAAGSLANAFLYNTTRLPSDVRTRYESKLAKNLITGRLLHQPFLPSDGSSVRFHYHNDANRALILSDGSLFMLNQTLNRKALLTAEIWCEDDTYAGVRGWYEGILQPVCMSLGLYIHPFWCFRKDSNHERGFTCGNDPDDDLPKCMEVPLSHMSPLLYQMLCNPKMFPKESWLRGELLSCETGDGYKALLQITFKAHPVNYDNASTLVKRYPTQGDLSIAEYHKRFKDFQQLRAYIQNVNLDLSDDAEVDIFIDNAKYSTYLQRRTADDRRIASKKEDYRGARLVKTLDRLLLSSDSPARTDDQRAAQYGTSRYKPRFDRESSRDRGYDPYHKTKRRPDVENRKQLKTFPVHSLGSPLNDEVTPESSTSDDEIAGLPLSMNTYARAIYSIEVPHDSESIQIFHHYAAAVNKITSDPSAATTQTCICCGEQHTFDNCDILQNVDFLRGHYVRFCQQLKRDAAALTSEKMLRPKHFANNPIKPKMPMNFLDTKDCLHYPSDCETNATPALDFQNGRG